jgi:hypothetical protein
MKTDLQLENFGGNKYAFNKARKLTEDQRQKVHKVKDLIGYEVEFTIGTKNRKARIVAVSLPNDTVTIYPTGEINEKYNKEFAHKYCGYPFDFRLQIEGREEFWTSSIDKLNLSNPVKTIWAEKYIQFNNLDQTKLKYM